MMKFYSKKGGFTLPEVLVSMSVLVLTVFTATNLVVSIIRSNTENMNTLIAYGLAQEGLESIRNIRDSNWLLNGKFNGEVSKANVQVWGAAFPSDPQNPETHYYTVEYKDPQMTNTVNFSIGQSISNLNLYTPWRLEDITSVSSVDYGVLDKTLIKKDSENDEVKYLHSSAGEATPFHRYIAITPVPYTVQEGTAPEAKFLKMRVTSVVNWLEYGRKKEVRLDTELTDWKTNM